MNIIVKNVMFYVIGAVLATAGVGVTDWQLYATLIAAAVAAYI